MRKKETKIYNTDHLRRTSLGNKTRERELLLPVVPVTGSLTPVIRESLGGLSVINYFLQ